MYARGRKKGMVRFTYKAVDGVQDVSLAADFNGWSLVPMKRQKDGQFAVEMPVAPGTHEYKFLVDGTWQTDPDHTDWALNPHGTFNSVAQV
jgi:1,4-alpha-glucan branching enzyme